MNNVNTKLISNLSPLGKAFILAASIGVIAASYQLDSNTEPFDVTCTNKHDYSEIFNGKAINLFKLHGSHHVHEVKNNGEINALKFPKQSVSCQRKGL